ncbi:MAG: CRTAC1 family protein [Acidobacteria bacterium]|nr:CRTAC1 family protein [Acidobacteriota bacterium]
MGAVAHIDEYKRGLHFSAEFRGDMSWNGYEYNNLLRNEGCTPEGNGCQLHFSDVAMALGADDLQDSRGIAIADFDHDGDLDIAVNHNTGDRPLAPQGPAVLLRNDVGSARSWLSVELRGTQSNRDGVGAQVTVEAGGLHLLRQAEAGSSYASQQSSRLHFGLGEATVVDRLTVRWPSGVTETFEDLPARSRVRIVEEEGLTTLQEP